jgi:2-dehydropantoate 2-reductase
MRTAVMGAGGLGGYYGGLLARAVRDVAFVARGAHLAALRADGLTVRSEFAGGFRVPVVATADAAEIGPVDLVLFCVKNYDLDAAAAAARPLIGPDTVVLSVLNGVDAAERIERVLGPGRVLAGVCYVASRVDAPGMIVQGGMSGKLFVGEPGGGASGRANRVADLLASAGALVEVHPAVDVALWEKMVGVCPAGGVMALMRLPIGPIMACPEARAFFRAAMDEVEAVARARGVALPDGCAERLFTMISQQKPWYRSSMLTDVLGGRRLELEWLNGVVVRLGRELAVPTPANGAVYAALKPFADGAPTLPTPPD